MTMHPSAAAMPWRTGRTRAGNAARGVTAHASGMRAEERVADHYAERGYRVVAGRWRSAWGEIDLIAERGGEYVFVEVKKSATHSQAAARINRRQIDRICHAAMAFCDTLATGSLTLMRFDAACVDASGQIDVIQNAFGGN